ncbi:hypothetical protein [Halothermothrix orenii]|uniref:Uncharacterized protein n=1 Tax=Halothermothrix orenii (strain H 168 / OCM 544 / DSM 9562) TaxID=373903 RepID=B8CZ87_HALOH|nr:hypothetical protein [Halothermothrix orenii]ACL70606.1 hypothetical protein Hore_18570 [Halothermothrix orenii H 168]
MRGLKIITIILFILIFAYKGYQIIGVNIYRLKSFNLDKSNYIILSERNGLYSCLEKGKNYDIEIKEKWGVYFARNMFFVNKNIICLVLGKKVYFYNYKDKIQINKIEITSRSIGINKNSQGDLILFSGGDLYEYCYPEDKLIKIKDLVEDPSDHSIYYPSLYIHPNKISYYTERNSVFYSAYIDSEKRLRGVYELSLDDFSLKLIDKGFCPQVDNKRKCLYYINHQQDSVIKLNLANGHKNVLFKYPHNIIDIVVVNDNMVFFVHASSRETIKGVKIDQMKVYQQGKIKTIYTRGYIYGSPFDVIEKKEINKE